LYEHITQLNNIMYTHIILEKRCIAGLITLILFSAAFPGAAQKKEPVDYVDPFIGTSNSRWMLFPGPTMPNGMVKLSPDNQGSVWQGGYEYSVGSIHGFSHIHGWTMAGLMTMPTNGDLSLKPGSPDDPFKGANAGYHSRIRPEAQVAAPGYYAVDLIDSRIRAELTATERTGVQRYALPADSSNRVMVQLNIPAEYSYELRDARITKTSNSEIRGYAKSYSGWFNEYTLYFVMQFSKPFKDFHGYANQKELPEGKEISGSKDVGAYVTFPTSKEEKLLIRTGISFVSQDQAQLNLQTELRDFDWDFDALVTHNRSIWNNILKTIEVEGDSETDKTKFYTNLYRCFTGKMTMSDVNGKYIDATENVQNLSGDRKAMIGGDAFWNTFWNLNLLWTLTAPETVEQLVDTQLEMFEKTGWLSKGPTGIEYSGIMEGSHEMALMTSAYLKGIVKKDAALAYQAMKKNVEIEPTATGGGHPGNPQITEYAKIGYMPVEKGAASKTLDYAFDDWCVAQMARLVHNKKDYNFFLKRSANWKNAFDPKIKYVVPRKEDGTFIKGFDLFSVNHFVEGNSWQYSLYVPHDIPELLKYTGKDVFLDRLKNGFKKSEQHKFAAHALDRTTGQSAEYYINHGNEVNMQAAYLFNYAGKPELTQYYTRKILDTFYDASPYVGWNGDEDEGQMGAWFVMSALGLFEMNGGTSPDLLLDITSPLFKSAKIKLNNKYYPGKEFIIEAHDNSAENVYIKSTRLNGQLLKENKISFKDVVKGGKLELFMTDRLN
jgi:predicted alpha-1,2-mannosidase